MVENGKETIVNIDDEIPFDIPESWAWCRLGNAINLISGRDLMPSEYNDVMNGIPYLTGASNIINGQININRWTTSPKSIAQVGSILLTCKGTVGLTSILEGIEKVHIARQFMALNSIGIFNKFLKLIIDSYSCSLKKDATSMIPGVSREQILSLILALPPFEEQKRIVEAIENLTNNISQIDGESSLIEEKISLAKSKLLDLAIRGKLLPQDKNDEPASELLKHIREEKESTQLTSKSKHKTAVSYIFKGEDNLYYRKTKDGIELIDDELPFKLPENWQWAQISDVCVLYTGNSIPKEVKAKKYASVSLGYNYIGTKDVGYNSQINYENGVKIPFDEPKFKVAPTNSILLCIEGGNAGRKIAITKENVCFGNKLCCFIAKGINYCFLYNYLKSSIFKELFYGSLMGLIGGVGTSSLEKIYIPIPPLQEQERISEFLTSAFDQLDSLAQH